MKSSGEHPVGWVARPVQMNRANEAEEAGGAALEVIHKGRRGTPLSERSQALKWLKPGVRESDAATR